MKWITKLVTTTLAVLVTAYLLPGVEIKDAWMAIVVAVVISILNILVKPILILLTLPVTILTLGLFLLVINAVIILITSAIVEGFIVNGFWWALLFSLILSLVSSALNSLIESDENRNN